MTHTITIAGKPFTVEPRYAEGHTLSANEATALNQTYFENLRNNFANKAKEGADQEAFNEYASAYEFGARSGGGGSRDPIEVEAMNLARDAVRKGLQAAGKKISDYSAAAISAAASKLLERDGKYRELARERVEQMKGVAGNSIDEDLMATLNEAQAEAAESESEGDTEGEAPASRRRKSAE